MLNFIQFFIFFGWFLNYINDSSVVAEIHQRTASRLHHLIADVRTNENIPNFVFSPHSVLSAAVMLAHGAAGSTLADLNKIVNPNIVMHLPDFSKKSSGDSIQATIDLANRIYVPDKLRNNSVFQNFSEKLFASGKAGAEVADYKDSAKTAAEINKYISDSTRGHIRDLVRPGSIIYDHISLVLVNALYFKARWAERFSKEETFRGPFKTLRSFYFKDKTVEFMTHAFERSPVMYYEDENVKAVAVPYAVSGLFMYIIVPKSIFYFEIEMGEDPTMLDSIIEKVRTSVTSHDGEELILTMPKFKLYAEDNKLDLMQYFSSLGSKDMFYPGFADFSGINGNKDLFVSYFLHQADITVDEDGTEATAATEMNIMSKSMPRPKEQLHVVIDSSFVFQVRYSEPISSDVFKKAEDDIILISGRISDPTYLPFKERESQEFLNKFWSD